MGFCLEMTKFWEEGWLQLVATNRELETVRRLSCAFKDLRTEGRPGGESGAPAPPGSGFCRLRLRDPPPQAGREASRVSETSKTKVKKVGEIRDYKLKCLYTGVLRRSHSQILESLP